MKLCDECEKFAKCENRRTFYPTAENTDCPDYKDKKIAEMQRVYVGALALLREMVAEFKDYLEYIDHEENWDEHFSHHIKTDKIIDRLFTPKNPEKIRKMLGIEQNYIEFTTYDEEQLWNE